MARTNWEADKMLDVYIYDYLVKRNLHATAKAFISEGKVATDPVAIDAPGGFLFEWWSIFWDIFHSKTSTTSSSNASTSIDNKPTPTPQQLQALQAAAPSSLDLDVVKSREHQMKLQLLQQHNAHLHSTRDSSAPIAALNSDVSAVLASKMMQDRLRNPNPVHSDASQHLLDANRITLLKSPPNHAGPPMQQIQSRNQQLDIKPDVAMPQRTMPTDPSSLYGSGMMQSKPLLLSSGLNQGVGSVPLKGWPLTVPGIDQLRSSIGVQKQLMPSSNQFQLLSPQQQLISQAQTQNDLSRMGSPAPSGSPNVRSDDPDYLMKLKMVQMQQSSGHRPIELQQPHQQVTKNLWFCSSLWPILNEFTIFLGVQNTRKRKTTSSGAANSTGTGNTVGPSPPSTPSTHTPGGGVPVASNVNIVQKSSVICGADGTSGLASSSNQMDNLDSFVDFDENVDSFLSNDDGDGRDMFAALKKGSSEHNSESLKSLSLGEVGNNRASNNKVVCCHFSTDGKLLASAGHEKKVFLWNMENFKMDAKIEDHTNFITDIRFKTNSTQLATSSSDGTVRLWNAADESGALQTFHGHSSHVTSVDFHPRLTEVLCSCDDNGEIRFWKVGQTTTSHAFRVKQGGTGRVRFQPRSGQLLAVAAGSMVNIFDVEKQANLHSPPKGHNSEVNCVCWDENGEYLASASQDTVKVWSVASGICIHELRSHGHQYQSCIFHPRYPKVLIVGGYQTLELWSLSDNQRNPIQAHEGLIAALAHSPFTGMIASASHDRYVKLWK
ncbi:transcriptional corepressor LEUNIG_HOMOLOG-like isoform X2 [Phragmites australis]|uniref:transcriptional corepressor LEUNIG_HOMOLOG-like isoform X2 n=1 Tax=Phragmites australis TaxID=29695 RepID=UPI002D78138B|nr:transcriptional corepressor LEUNIG_HOMOLOG-like isoform X2 [Phragmites australis]